MISFTKGSRCPKLIVQLEAGLLLASAVLGSSLSVAAQDTDPTLLIDDLTPRVTVAFSPTELTVGDRVTAVLTVTAPEGLLAGEPRFPDWNATWGAAEILQVDAPEALDPRGGVAAFRQRLVLASFRPGDVPLPPREIELGESANPARLTTPADLALHIVPVLPEPAEESRDPGAPEPEIEPRPEEPPQVLPLSRSFWWAMGTAAAGCLALALLLWKRARLPAVQRPETLSPLARLERDLTALPAVPSAVEGHALLSKALRRYLGGQLGFPAPESTTTEIRRRLNARQVPDTVHRGTGEVLSACDLVKFARRATSADGLERHTRTARQVGRELESHLHPPRPEPAGEPAP